MRPFTKRELELLRKQPYDEASTKKELAIKKFIDGISGFDVKKALAGKPTCTICGLISGYTGAGSKTVLPKDALAKIDFRLVPNMDPKKLSRNLRVHLDTHGFKDVEISYSEGEKAKRTLPDEPIARAALEAARNVHERPPVVSISSAGTGPMYLFRAPCVAIGGGYAFSRSHSPNENTRIDLFLKGMKWVADTVDRFGAF